MNADNMVCVTEEESVVCCVHNDSANALGADELCTNYKGSVKVSVRASHNVEYLIHAVAKEFDLEVGTFELYIQRKEGLELPMTALSDSKHKLLKDIGVLFEKNAYNYFIIRDVIANDTYNGVCATNNGGAEDLGYRDNDDLLLGASASPTAIEGPQNLTQGPAGEDPLLISVLMRQDSIPYVGLVNQAMTCYLNSLLQALYMTPEFRNALYNWAFDGYDPAKSIPYQLQKLFLNLQTSTKSAVETTELTRSFGWDLSEAWQQHDIQELCRVMFDALEQKFKDTDQADLINRLYQGKMIDYVKCLECKTEKSREDTFLDIPLPVRPFGSTVAYCSVEEALRAFVQPETLDGNNQYYCDTCQKKCDAHKGLKFSTIPYLLTLHLKRFDFDYSTMHRIKLNDKVTFPETLDLNSFVTSHTVDEALEATAEEVVSVKCDDSSTTDSGSALDDESCQGTEPSTSTATVDTASTSSTCAPGASAAAPASEECPEDDEGIDVSSNLQENEKNRRHNEQKGPYVYELFSIMIHSGSASGGHYYAYIKDFRKGKWFCFDDQSVSKITYDDIRKTYGGGPLRSYYSGAYSSSTNAYMLMYRQIDSTRNVPAMTAEDFPAHIKTLLQSLREREEFDRMNREREMVMCKLKLFVNHPQQAQLVETKLYLHNETTLREATDEAFRKAKLDNVVPIEQCRLVSYNRLQDSIECSFEGRDDETIADIIASLKCTLKSDWLLEIRARDGTFTEYKPGGINMKVYIVNIELENVTGPLPFRGYESQTVAEFKELLAKLVNMPRKEMKIASEPFNTNSAELVLFEHDADDALLSQTAISSACKVYVTSCMDEDVDKPFVITRFHKIIDKFEHIIAVDVVLPVNDKWTLEVLSIPPLDVNQNCCEKLEIGSGEPATVSVPLNQSPKLHHRVVQLPPAPPAAPPMAVPSPASTSSSTVSSTSTCSTTASNGVQPPPGTEPEDVVDQSNSEDSSLSDSDRTLVGDAPDECLAQLSSASNSPAASEPHLSSPEDGPTASGTAARSVNVYLEENWDEDRLGPINYFKATELPSEPNEHVGKTLRILIDKRTNLVKLKKYLEPYVGVPMEYFKVYKQYASQEIECARLTETLCLTRDGEKIVIKLGRVLRENEHAGKVYQLTPNGTAEPIRFLCDWVVAKGQTVGQAKRDILEAIRKQYQIDIPYERCRLRKKNWKSPSKVYLDELKFIDDILLLTNWEMFLQELPAPEVVTDVDQLLLFVRRWCPATLELKPFQEVLIEDTTVAEFKEKIAALSGIPVDQVEISMLKGTFPYDMSVLGVHTDLEWNHSAAQLNDYPYNVFDSGHAFLYRDAREQLKQLTAEERKEICSKESGRIGRFSKSNLYSPRKERALKIYLDTSPKKSDEPEVD